jgi:hypothetical protein
MRYRVLLLWIVIGVLGWVAQGAERAPAAAPERFTFVAMGCMPYGEEHYSAYERLLNEISRQRRYEERRGPADGCFLQAGAYVVRFDRGGGDLHAGG